MLVARVRANRHLCDWLLLTFSVAARANKATTPSALACGLRCFRGSRDSNGLSPINIGRRSGKGGSDKGSAWDYRRGAPHSGKHFGKHPGSKRGGHGDAASDENEAAAPALGDWPAGSAFNSVTAQESDRLSRDTREAASLGGWPGGHPLNFDRTGGPDRFGPKGGKGDRFPDNGGNGGFGQPRSTNGGGKGRFHFDGVAKGGGKGSKGGGKGGHVDRGSKGRRKGSEEEMDSETRHLDQEAGAEHSKWKEAALVKRERKDELHDLMMEERPDLAMAQICAAYREDNKGQQDTNFNAFWTVSLRSIGAAVRNAIHERTNAAAELAHELGAQRKADASRTKEVGQLVVEEVGRISNLRDALMRTRSARDQLGPLGGTATGRDWSALIARAASATERAEEALNAAGMAWATRRPAPQSLSAPDSIVRHQAGSNRGGRRFAVARPREPREAGIVLESLVGTPTTASPPAVSGAPPGGRHNETVDASESGLLGEARRKGASPARTDTRAKIVQPWAASATAAAAAASEVALAVVDDSGDQGGTDWEADFASTAEEVAAAASYFGGESAR